MYDVAKNLSALNKIEPIARYVSENYMNRVTLDDLSECAKYDKYYICKLIKGALNTTFTEYLTYVRLQMAERLLFSTDKPISEIVYETGFSTPQNFFKVFKAAYGYTPHKYKMLYRPTGPT
jgi:AraC-like DNA-binding protein